MKSRMGRFYHCTHVTCILSPFASLWTSSQCASLRFRRAIREKCPKFADTIGLTLHSASRNTCTKHRNEKIISSYGALSCSNCLRSRGGTRIRECSAFYFLFSTAIRTNLDWRFHWFSCVLQDLRVWETETLLNFSNLENVAIYLNLFKSK